MIRGGKLALTLAGIIMLAWFGAIVPAQAADPQALLIDKPDIKIDIPNLSLTNSSDITVQGSAPNQYYVIPWIAEYIKGVYQFGVGAAVVLAVAMIVFGGFIWMTAGGNAQQVTTAKSYIIGAITGIVLALGSYSILYLVNPNLTKLTPLRVPIIGRIGLGNYCSSIVQPGETLYEVSNTQQTSELPKALNPGEKTTCGSDYSRSSDSKTTSFCVGSYCSADRYCTPNQNLKDGKPTYGCGTKSNLATNCKVLNKNAPFVVSSHPPENACNEFNSSPGVLDEGRCVWFNASWIANAVSVTDGCLWCSNDAYERTTAAAQKEIDEKNAQEATRSPDQQVTHTKKEYCGTSRGGLQILQAFSDALTAVVRGDEGLACVIKYCQGM